MRNIQQVSTDENVSIREYDIFKNLTTKEVEMVQREITCSAYKRGIIVYHEGSRINGFYLISKGILKIYKTGIDGKEQIIRFAQKGDIIGFRSVISQELACTTAKVLEDGVLCYMPGDILNQLIKSNSDFAMELMRLTCRELGEANKYLTDIAQKTVRERLAEVLLILMDNFDLDQDNYLNISLTREELANMVGTATESVIRLLSEFKNDKIIELQGRRIKLVNIQALIKIGNVYV